MNRKWMPLMAAVLMVTTAVASAAQFAQQVPVGPQDLVKVSNIAGSVTITTWDRPEVGVQGETDAGVERVDVRQVAGGVEIRVIVADRDTWKDVGARLQIQMPASAQLEVTTVSASLAASGVRGRSRLKSVSGNIRTDMPGADLDVKTVSGNMELTGSGAPGRVRASSVSGDMIMSRIAGEVDARSTSGNMDVAVEAAKDVRIHGVSGDIVARGTLLPGGNLEVDSLSGRVKVAAQVSGGFRYDVSSFSGTVSSCSGGQVVRREGRSSGGHMEGVQGEGQGNLRIKSHSGSVEFCDR